MIVVGIGNRKDVSLVEAGDFGGTWALIVAIDERAFDSVVIITSSDHHSTLASTIVGAESPHHKYSCKSYNLTRGVALLFGMSACFDPTCTFITSYT